MVVVVPAEVACLGLRLASVSSTFKLKPPPPRFAAAAVPTDTELVDACTTPWASGGGTRKAEYDLLVESRDELADGDRDQGAGGSPCGSLPSPTLDRPCCTAASLRCGQAAVGGGTARERACAALVACVHGSRRPLARSLPWAAAAHQSVTEPKLELSEPSAYLALLSPRLTSVKENSSTTASTSESLPSEYQSAADCTTGRACVGRDCADAEVGCGAEGVHTGRSKTLAEAANPAVPRRIVAAAVTSPACATSRRRAAPGRCTGSTALARPRGVEECRWGCVPLSTGSSAAPDCTSVC